MSHTRLSTIPDHVQPSVRETAYALFDKKTEGTTWREIAESLNRIFFHIDLQFDGEYMRDLYRRYRGKKGHKAPTPEETQVYDVDTAVNEEELAKIMRQLTETQATNRRLFTELRRSQARTEDLVKAAEQGAYDAFISMGGVPLIKRPKLDDRPKDRESALWHLTDWQGAKRTTSYNEVVMAERVLRFCDKAELITDIQRADHPVRDVVIVFGGDMVEGLFNFPTQPFEISMTLFDQYVTVSQLLVQVVQRALAIYDHVKVVAEWGNHGRLGSKRDAVPRADNLDRMCYHLARRLLENEPRLTWEDCPEDVQRLDIGEYKALAIHGDEIGRNGFASLNTILQHVNRWRSGAYPWEFRDVYVAHYHVHYELPLANGLGAVYGTGSTESDNRYAREMLASAARPSQRLHFIDKERGRVSAQYKIYVDDEAIA